MATIATAKDFSRVLPSGLNTPVGDSVPDLDTRLLKVETFATEAQTAIGTDDVVDPSSLTGRIQVLEEIGSGYNLHAAGISTSNSAAVNTAALQTTIDNLGAFGGFPMYLPPGTYNFDRFTNRWSNNIIRGLSASGTQMRYVGSGAGNWFCTIGSTIDAINSRPLRQGFENIWLHNAATSGADTQQGAILDLNSTHSYYEKTRFSHWRNGAILASNHSDSYYDKCEFEWCGSQTGGLNVPVLSFNSLESSWAVDEMHLWGCRFEHNGERIINAITGGRIVSKIRFTDCKFENDKTDADGLSGDLSTGAQFYFEQTDGTVFQGCDFTYSGLQSGFTGPVPTMFKLKNTNGFMMSNCMFGTGSLGADIKPFTNYFDCDGDTASLFSNLFFTSGNDGCYPDNVWKFQNGGGKKFARHGCTWGYAPGTEPTTDSGSPNSTADWA